MTHPPGRPGPSRIRGAAPRRRSTLPRIHRPHAGRRHRPSRSANGRVRRVPRRDNPIPIHNDRAPARRLGALFALHRRAPRAPRAGPAQLGSGAAPIPRAAGARAPPQSLASACDREAAARANDVLHSTFNFSSPDRQKTSQIPSCRSCVEPTACVESLCSERRRGAPDSPGHLNPRPLHCGASDHLSRWPPANGKAACSTLCTKG